MINKSSIIEAAQKFAAKGQIDKSIAELEKLLKEGKDVNIYNAIGDLYLRKGAQKEAAEFFTKAANSYKDDGFALKAIALYKKILNIIPNSPDVLTSLAVLNAEKGFTANAVEDLIKAAEIYNRSGKPEKTLDLYEKALHLAPFDMKIRLKIIDLYLSMGLKERAANGYSSVASDFLGKDDLAKAQELYTKAIEIDPQNISALMGLSRLAEKENNLEKALEYLAQASSYSPEDKNLLMNYVNLAIKSDRSDDAKKSLARLVEIDPADMGTRRLLGSLYLKGGEFESAWRELLPCVEESIKVRNWDEALELLINFKELYPIPVRERIIKILREKNDKDALLIELKELAMLYEGTGSHNEAYQLYKEVLEIDPHDAEIKDKMRVVEETITPPPAQEVQAVQEKNIASTETDQETAAPSEVTAQEAAEETAPTGESLNIEDKDIDDIFSELGKNYEEDYESHYIAGVDYRLKGMFDEAIGEFEIASNDPERSVLSSMMIALCYMGKKEYDLAIAAFNRILEKMSPEETNYLRIKYELAEAYISSNDYEKAIEVYSEIRTRDPEFRDVSDKINSLKGNITSSSDIALEPERESPPEETVSEPRIPEEKEIPSVTGEIDNSDFEFMKPVISSVVNILTTMAKMEATAGKPAIKTDELARGYVTGLIVMAGKQAKGTLAISFSESAIQEITKRMLVEEVTNVSNYIYDMAGEITNMLTGGAKKILSEKGYFFDTAIPTVISGKNHIIRHNSKEPVVIVPFKTEAGDFYIEFCFEVIQTKKKRVAFI